MSLRDEIHAIPRDGMTRPVRAYFRITAAGLRRTGQLGMMVARFADPSYDDVEMRFADGKQAWYDMRDVKRVPWSELRAEIRAGRQARKREEGETP